MIVIQKRTLIELRYKSMAHTNKTKSTKYLVCTQIAVWVSILSQTYAFPTGLAFRNLQSTVARTPRSIFRIDGISTSMQSDYDGGTAPYLSKVFFIECGMLITAYLISNCFESYLSWSTFAYISLIELINRIRKRFTRSILDKSRRQGLS